MTALLDIPFYEAKKFTFGDETVVHVLVEPRPVRIVSEVLQNCDSLDRLPRKRQLPVAAEVRGHHCHSSPKLGNLEYEAAQDRFVPGLRCRRK